MDTSEDGEDETKIEPATDDNMKDFYSESYSCCKILVEFMLDRCTQESIAGENNKVIITHFVDDLLVTLDRPEYPATDMVLNIMVLTLAKNYLKSDKPDPVRIMAIQILATIATRAIDDTSLNSSNVAKLVEDYNISGSEDEESRYVNPKHANLLVQVSHLVRILLLKTKRRKDDRNVYKVQHTIFVQNLKTCFY
jgi:hypothetical protein